MGHMPTVTSTRTRGSLVLLALAAAALLFVALVSPVVAAKGGNGNGKGHNTITVDDSTDSGGLTDGFASFSGNVSGSSSDTVSYGSDPADDLMVALNWDNPKNDLRLVVTNTCGEEFISDLHIQQSYEVVAVAGPLCVGDWTFTVENDGGGNVKYSLWARFG